MKLKSHLVFVILLASAIRPGQRSSKQPESVPATLLYTYKMRIRNLLPLLICTLLAVISAAAQTPGAWTKMPLPCTARMEGFIPLTSHFFEDGSGLIVGTDGGLHARSLLIRVGAGGTGCKLSLGKKGSYFEDISFTSRLRGRITASRLGASDELQGVILDSFDGGKTWTEDKRKHPWNGSSKSSLDHIRFTDENTGFITAGVQVAKAAFGALYKTTDGGKTWRTIFTAPEDVLFKSIGFDSSGKNGWLITNKSTVYRTIDSGEKWLLQTTPIKKEMEKIAVIGQDEAWITSHSSSLLHTVDGGITWREVKFEIDDTELTEEYAMWFSGIFFDGKGNGWVSGSGGAVMRTRDNGKTWKLESRVKDTRFLYDIRAFGDQLITVGAEGIAAQRRVN